MQLDDIVNVQVTAQTAAVSQAGFGTPLIMGVNASSHFDSGELVREYSDPSAMLTDGFIATDIEYLMAVQVMGQVKKPSRFLIGVQSLHAQDVNVLTYTGTLTSGTVAVRINKTEYSQAFDTDQDTTMTALAVLIAADAGISNCTWNDIAQTLTITGEAGEPVSYKNVSDGDFTDVARTFTLLGSTVATDLLNIDGQNDSWYALLLTSEARDDILAGVSAVNTRDKVIGVDIYDEAALVLTDETDLASEFKTNAEGRVLTMYKEARDEFYLASWFGRMLPETPGQANWAYKTLAGVPTYKLTSAEQGSLREKNSNMYEEIGGVNVPFSGELPNGSYMDILRGSDWLAARIQENVYQLLISSDKVPYTDQGFVLIDSSVFSILKLGVANGLLVDDDYLRVEMPVLADISASDKANRHLPDVKFYGHLQGAVNTVAISGTLTLP